MGPWNDYPAELCEPVGTRIFVSLLPWGEPWGRDALTSVSPSLGAALGLLPVPRFRLPLAGSTAFSCSGTSPQVEIQPGAGDSGHSTQRGYRWGTENSRSQFLENRNQDCRMPGAWLEPSRPLPGQSCQRHVPLQHLSVFLIVSAPQVPLLPNFWILAKTGQAAVCWLLGNRERKGSLWPDFHSGRQSTESHLDCPKIGRNGHWGGHGEKNLNIHWSYHIGISIFTFNGIPKPRSQTGKSPAWHDELFFM